MSRAEPAKLVATAGQRAVAAADVHRVQQSAHEMRRQVERLRTEKRHWQRAIRPVFQRHHRPLSAALQEQSLWKPGQPCGQQQVQE